jgi:hypothetical protein
MSRTFQLIALCEWVALMGIIWSLVVPGGLSAATFTLLALSGPLLLAAVSIVRGVSRPAPAVHRVRGGAAQEPGVRPRT